MSKATTKELTELAGKFKHGEIPLFDSCAVGEAIIDIIDRLEAEKSDYKQSVHLLASTGVALAKAEATIKAIGEVECIVDKIRYAADSTTERQYVIDLLLLFDEESGSLIKEHDDG